MPANPSPPILSSPPGAQVVVDGKTYDYFGGTGYLGLQGHLEVIEAACRGAHAFGIHAATSRTRFASQPVLNVERLAAGIFATEAAFYFVSGYLGNAILVQALAGTVDAIFLDEGSHYSVSEAAALGGVPVHRFRSRDPDDLAEQLRGQLAPGQRPLVMSDGVFPSFGWIAPVPRYLEVLADHPGAAILIDDAHGFGVLGTHGRGTLEHHGLWERANTRIEPEGDTRIFVVGTTSKAFGGFGGLIPCSQVCHRAVTTACHCYDGASAPAAPVAAGTARALQLVEEQPELRRRLLANTATLRAGLRDLGLEIADLPTPILGFTRGRAADMQRLHDDLAAAGILVPYAAAYSGLGPEGAMRLAVFATHTDAALARLIDTMGRVLC